MRFVFSASSILCLGAFFALSACDTLGLPNLTREDEVPESVKEQPMLIDVEPVDAAAPWPRLGDVPFKPKDFSPKPVYDHYIGEMGYHRAEGEAARKKLLSTAPEADAALQPPSPALSQPDTGNASSAALMPPQFKK